MRNVIDITENVDEKSLVLLDEIGAGTDPEEGSALARAVLDYLIEKGSYGIVTTHYTVLKEYAFAESRVKNASMDFDENTFAPLYRLTIGLAGSSNALKIAYKLGLSPKLVEDAKSFLSERKVNFEKVIEEAEKTRRQAEEKLNEYAAINAEKQKELELLKAEHEKFDREREKFYLNAKIESRRIINENLEDAENIVGEIKAILDRDEIDSGALIKARTLKNRLEEQKYRMEKESRIIFSNKPVDTEKIRVNDRVYVSSFDNEGIVVTINKKKKVCEVNIDGVRATVGFSELYIPVSKPKKKDTQVHITRSEFSAPVSEINVIGKNLDDALFEVEQFLDHAVVSGLDEIKIIHGVGLKILSKGIHDFLRKYPHTLEYRFGKYGEGEHGVTFVRLK